MEDEEQVRQLVCARIGEVEQQVKCLQTLRKTLLQKAYEAKQSILSQFVSERESMYSKEMTLLSEVDNLLHNKDDTLVTQLNKLNQVLGCLRNCLESPHPCGDCLEKYDDIDMLKVEEVDMEFTSAQELLKNACDLTKQVTLENAMEMSNDGHMTKWLLTPTNNHSVEDSLSTGPKDFTSTEWLIQYHAQTKSAVETGSLFQSVMTGKQDDWLTDRVVSVGNSLSTYALTNFESIVSEASEGWLEKAPVTPYRERTVSDSISESSVCTSSLSSSCVIIPSVTSCDTTRTSVSKPPVFSVSEKHDSHVDLWVAECESSEEWLVSNRPRLMSAGSASLRSALRAPQPYNEWIADGYEPTIKADRPALGVYEGESDNWLAAPAAANAAPSCYDEQEGMDDTTVSVSDNKEWIESARDTQKDVQAWLPVITSKMEALANEYPDEKLDVSFEKTESDDWLVRVTLPDQCADNLGCCNKCSDWLAEAPPATSPQKSADAELASKNDWLSGEEKKDVSVKMRGAATPACLVDREWLLVINMMNKISSSALSDWLSVKSEAPVSAPNPFNKQTTAQLCDWLR